MPNVLVNKQDIQNISDAIRGKTGESNKMKVSNMASEITNIPSGGGDSNIKLFLSKNEMYNDASAKEDDLGVIYFTNYINFKNTVNTLWMFKLPKRVTLPDDLKVTSNIYCSLENDMMERIMIDISKTNVNIDIELSSLRESYTYTSTDGINYIGNFDEDLFIDIFGGFDINYEYSSLDERLNYFIQIKENTLEGIYRYIKGINGGVKGYKLKDYQLEVISGTPTLKNENILVVKKDIAQAWESLRDYIINTLHTGIDYGSTISLMLKNDHTLVCNCMIKKEDQNYYNQSRFSPFFLKDGTVSLGGYNLQNTNNYRVFDLEVDLDTMEVTESTIDPSRLTKVDGSHWKIDGYDEYYYLGYNESRVFNGKFLEIFYYSGNTVKSYNTYNYPSLDPDIEIYSYSKEDFTIK